MEKISFANQSFTYCLLLWQVGEERNFRKSHAWRTFVLPPSRHTDFLGFVTYNSMKTNPRNRMRDGDKCPRGVPVIFTLFPPVD